MGEGATGGDRRGRQRLTVPEAATVLGVTVDAVRGRIRWGKLASEHDENGTVYVWIDAPEANGPGQSPTVEGPEEASQGPSAEREELVESLLDQVKYMREQIAAEREANRENRRLLAAALERIPALERQSREAPRRLAMRILLVPTYPRTGRRHPRAPGGSSGANPATVAGLHTSPAYVQFHSLWWFIEEYYGFEGSPACTGPTPSCRISPRASNCPQCSTILPSAQRVMCISLTVTCFPVAGMPMNSPL